MIAEKEIRDDMIENNLSLVHYVIKRYFKTFRGSLSYEDMFQQGTIGLLKAVEQYNSDITPNFSTFAVPKILGELQRYRRDMSDDSSGVKFSRQAKSIAYKLWREGITEDEASKLKVESLMKEHNVTRYIAESALLFLNYRQTVSLDKKPNVEDNEKVSIHNMLESEDDDSIVEVTEFIKSLSPKLQKVVRLRLMGLKQREIGEETGVSQAHVNRHLKKVQQLWNSYTEGEEVG